MFSSLFVTPAKAGVPLVKDWIRQKGKRDASLRWHDGNIIISMS